MLLNVSMFMYVLLLTRISAYILACNFTHMHILPLSIVGNGRDEGREYKKQRVSEEGVGNGLLQSEWFLFFLILNNFMMANGLFDVNMKYLLC